MNIIKRTINSLILLTIVFAFNLSKLDAQHMTLAEVSSELTNDGYNDVGVPNDHTPIYSGATITYFTKPGFDVGIFVYHWNSEHEIPSQAAEECNHKAFQRQTNTDPPEYYRECVDEGTDCRYVVEYGDNGLPKRIYWICCN
jgi:hypothetical protein